MATPLSSVIVPAYKVAPFIEATLASVIGQSLSAWECIVDDGSPDASAAIVERIEDPRVRLIRQANAGVSTARNAGFAASVGEAALFLDGDDTLHPDALKRMHAYLQAHPDCVACFGTMIRTDAAGKPEPGHA